MPFVVLFRCSISMALSFEPLGEWLCYSPFLLLLVSFQGLEVDLSQIDVCCMLIDRSKLTVVI